MRQLLPRVSAMVALLAGCGRMDERSPDASASTSASAGPNADTIASAGTIASSNPVDELDPDEEALLRGSLVELTEHTGQDARVGIFEALLATPWGRRVAIAEPALVAEPTAYRTSLAYYRLARALGAHVVPVKIVRAFSLRELGDALDQRPRNRAPLRDLRVQNDGTVDVLLATRSSASAGSPWDASSGTPFDPDASREVAAWDRWAGALAPLRGEDSALLHDYVEMLVLDYLSANVARRTATRSGSSLVLSDNRSAFPPHADRPTLDRMLRHLRSVARFPRGLRDALARFDRAAATAAFMRGSFEAWLLTPRAVVELDERRAALLTLVEARTTEASDGERR